MQNQYLILVFVHGIPYMITLCISNGLVILILVVDLYFSCNLKIHAHICYIYDT